MQISVDQLEKSAKLYSFIKEKPTREAFTDVTEEAFIPVITPEITRDNILGSAENLVKRKEMLKAVSPEPIDFALERVLGKNDSLYSNFVLLIENAKKKVGRIVIKQGVKNIGFATGFMVAENLLLTNWHVFKTIEEVGNSEIQFFYELDVLGNPSTAVCFKLQSDVFYFSNKDLDYCFVAVNPVDVSGQKSLKEIGYIFLDPALGKLGNEEEEKLNIIHHPDGDYMQLSIRENLFKKITPTSVWYETDTAPGSSGSPVFNDQWQVVALHHSGVAKKNDADQYVDMDGNIIPVINNTIDTAKIVWEANEGIRISVVLKDIFSNFPDNIIVKSLQKSSASTGLVQLEREIEKKEPPTTAKLNSDTMQTTNPDNNVHISFPASLIEKNGAVNISINQGAIDGIVTPQKQRSIISSRSEESIEEEIKKLEQATDFSLCKGYQSRFLGNNIPLPQPKESIKKFIARIDGTDSIILKYFNYSTIFHSVRMMPIISGINVEGDPAKRKDKAPRKDVWLRDTRLSFDIQLDDNFYKGSGFDRGHMSRREDADWGDMAEDAKRNADLTCMYTNACPQVAKINQSGKKGLWGILEKVVLESGAEKETGKTARISVFNGPVFHENDPVFKGIQVPMDFYKIVLWLTDNGSLKATAFKLTQTELIDDIHFEQLDLDQNTQFKEFQCSIKSLQEGTKIDFTEIIQFDTFDGADGEEVALNSAREVMTHIDKHNKQ